MLDLLCFKAPGLHLKNCFDDIGLPCFFCLCYALLYRFKIRYLVRETIHNFSCSTTMPWLRESRFMFCWVLVNSTSTIIYTMLWTYVWNYLIIEYLHQRKRNIDLKWCNISVISRIYFAPILMKNYLIIQAYGLQ